MTKNRGFTLIELLIVIAIIGIIGGIAYPSYQSHMIKAQRSDAQTELLKAQLEQTSLHILNPTYSNVIASIGLPTNSPHYTFSIVSAGAATYSMKAVAKSSSMQANDTEACKTLFIDQNSTHTSDGSTNNDQCW